MAANDKQVAGNHYKVKNNIQHWDFCAANDMDYFQGQITKYICRWKKKNGMMDLEKAQHFLEKYIELEKIKCVEIVSVRGSVSKEVVCTGQKYPFGYNDEEERDGSGV